MKYSDNRTVSANILFKGAERKKPLKLRALTMGSLAGSRKKSFTKERKSVEKRSERLFAWPV